MGKGKDWRLVKVGVEDNGDYRLTLPCISGGDVG